MIQYILECIAFQLLFLVIYDFFLKRETFFQWNRVYLLGTFLLSLILPWVKIKAFKQQVPPTFAAYPDFLWNLNGAQGVTIENPSGWQLSWQEGVFYSGMFFALLFFVIKLRQVYLLKKHGEQVQFPNFTQVIITNSSIAFSFFKSIFIGDKVLKMKHDTIIEHELVHIRQGHTWDLLFFEFMRIVAWFNPLVYVYQNRVSELHEFIADAYVAKEDKSEQYQQLLSQVFQTEYISFINQFFTKSLIKKRIVMLQKSKSKKVWQLKYLLLIPMVLGILFYTSCEVKPKSNNGENSLLDLNFSMIDEVPVFPGCENVADKRACFNEMMQRHISKNFSYPDEAQKAGIEGKVNIIFKIDENGNVVDLVMKGPDPLLEGEVMRIISKLPKMQPAKHQGKEVGIPYSIPIAFKLGLNSSKDSNKDSENKSEVPFAVVDEAPIFPGCEDATDKRACFNDKIQLHISKNFNYPQAAQDANIEGRVSTMFMISSEGVIENIKMRGPDKLLEDEVERIIKKLPIMIPGKNDGKSVNVPFSIPVQFKLQ
ncbi:M56 family metallopeptidase [uncultured Maribacter sp.]|uniref:M56 family metallopeptidase n=1 Tax=uncultured Maribacter sp. TaxID=431308 RepID=UPI0030ED808B